MANYSTSLKDWGATGSEYPTGYDYLEGEQPVDAWDNFLTYHIVQDIKQHLIPLTNDRVESDSGTTKPTSPETAHLFGDTGAGTLHYYDNQTTSWHRVMNADGDSMSGTLDMNGYQIEDSQGDITFAGDVQASRVYYTATGNWFDGGHDSLVEVSSNDHHIRPSAGTLLSEDGSQNFNVDEGNISHDGIDQTTVDSADHHIRPSAGTLLSEDTNQNFNVNEGSISHDGIDQATVSEADHHTRPVAGTNLDEDGSQNFNVIQGSGSGLDADSVDGKEPGDFLGTLDGYQKEITNNSSNGATTVATLDANIIPRRFKLSTGNNKSGSIEFHWLDGNTETFSTNGTYFVEDLQYYHGNTLDKIVLKTGGENTTTNTYYIDGMQYTMA